MATVLDLATAALQDLGVLAEGEVPTSGQSSDALKALNRRVDQWAAESLMMFRVTRSTWTISANDGSYTVGSGGNINISWPQFIEGVSFTDSTVSPAVETPLLPLTDDGYSAYPMKTQTSEYPTSWWFDRAYATGLGNLVLLPVPTSSTLTGVIYARTQVSEFSAITDTVYLPPGYRELIVTDLAARLASAYGRRSMLPELREEADRARRIVQAANLRLSDLAVDRGALGMGSRPVFNIHTGE